MFGIFKFFSAGLKIEKFKLHLTSGLANRLFYFQRMFEKIHSVPGEIVECGVGKAKSFQMLAMLMSYNRRTENLWGFDSFEGYPDPTAEDKSSRNRQRGEWNFLGDRLVRDVLKQAGIEEELLKRVRLIKGFVEDTLPKITDRLGPIALLHLDINLYAGYKTCLEKLFPKVAKGGVVLFDEYMNRNDAEVCPGAKNQERLAIWQVFFGKTLTPHLFTSAKRCGG
ncbi:MAG TPA: TylF/MycF/NovP-related O-methyltransferase [Candidatus Paceibacterota bacterium]